MSKYHYVYRITNTILNKHYYGVRSSKIEPNYDLGVKYFSSSTDKNFVSEQKENKFMFKYKIIKQFNTRKEANQLEIKLHLKFNVGVNESFYNKAIHTSSGFNREGAITSEETKSKIRDSNIGKKRTEETKQNISNSKKGRILSEEHKLKISESSKGKLKPKSEEHKLKISVTLKGRIISQETKNKMSESKKRKQRTTICPHCNKEGGVSGLNRYHFDNCKQVKL